MAHEPVPGLNSGQAMNASQGKTISHQLSATKAIALRMRFIDANPNPEITGIEPLPGKSNYFIGNDPKNWHTSVPHYAKVYYKEIYPEVDLVYYGSQGQLEYDLVIRPGADLSRVRFACEGAEGLSITDNGDLVIRLVPYSDTGTAIRELRKKRPHCYQEIDGKEIEVGCGFKVLNLGAGNGQNGSSPHVQQSVYGFEVQEYDKDHPLFIDPLIYSTFLGGNGEEQSHGIAVDSSGNAYVTGFTQFGDFPTTPGAFDVTFNGGLEDTFVTKLDATGSSLVFSTFLGGGF